MTVSDILVDFVLTLYAVWPGSCFRHSVEPAYRKGIGVYGLEDIRLIYVTIPEMDRIQKQKKMMIKK